MRIGRREVSSIQIQDVTRHGHWDLVRGAGPTQVRPGSRCLQHERRQPALKNLIVFQTDTVQFKGLRTKNDDPVSRDQGEDIQHFADPISPSVTSVYLL